jgi:hypothetical protein
MAKLSKNLKTLKDFKEKHPILMETEADNNNRNTGLQSFDICRQRKVPLKAVDVIVYDVVQKLRKGEPC